MGQHDLNKVPTETIFRIEYLEASKIPEVPEDIDTDTANKEATKEYLQSLWPDTTLVDKDARELLT